MEIINTLHLLMPSRMLGILEHYCACSTNLFEKCIRTFFPWSDTCSSFASFHSVLIASWCICTRIVSFKWKSEFLDLKFLEVCQNPVISFSCIPGIVVLLWNIMLFILVVLITCLNFFTSNFPLIGCIPLFPTQHNIWQGGDSRIRLPGWWQWKRWQIWWQPQAAWSRQASR